jgi:hypothetical protein
MKYRHITARAHIVRTMWVLLTRGMAPEVLMKVEIPAKIKD